MNANEYPKSNIIHDRRFDWMTCGILIVWVIGAVIGITVSAFLGWILYRGILILEFIVNGVMS